MNVDIHDEFNHKLIHLFITPSLILIKLGKRKGSLDLSYLREEESCANNNNHKTFLPNIIKQRKV